MTFRDREIHSIWLEKQDPEGSEWEDRLHWILIQRENMQSSYWQKHGSYYQTIHISRKRCTFYSYTVDSVTQWTRIVSIKN